MRCEVDSAEVLSSRPAPAAHRRYLKSGIPEAVLIPAPVWNTTLDELLIKSASSRTFLSSSSGGSKI